MRRSNSLSSIPIRERGRIERSRSVTRISKESTPSTSHIQKMSYLNPKQSRTPTTPSSIGARGRSSSMGHRKKLNNKEWQMEQYSKLKHYIANSGLFNPELEGILRNPSIANFVEIVSVLLQWIFHAPKPININNYHDIVLQDLKVLRYPGQITSSNIKTVNAKHGWPHFLSIISFLIDRVSILNIYDEFKKQQREEDGDYLKINDVLMDLFSKLYSNTNASQSNEDDMASLFNHMVEIKGIDLTAAENFSRSTETLQNEVDDLKGQLQQFEKESDCIEANNSEKQEVIDRLEVNNISPEQVIKEQIDHIIKSINKDKDLVAELTASIKNLEETIRTQKCKFEEKSKLLQQIEQLEWATDRRQAKLDEYRRIKDELDLEHHAGIREIAKLVDMWNLTLTRTFLPELKHLSLRDRGFCTNEFFQEVKKVGREVADIQKKLLEEYDNVVSELSVMSNVQETIMEKNSAVSSLGENLNMLRNAVLQCQEDRKKICFDIENIQKSHVLKINQIKAREESKIKENMEMLMKLWGRERELISQYKFNQREGLKIINETHNTVVKRLQKNLDLRDQKLVDLRTFLKKDLGQFTLSLIHLLEKLQTDNAKLYGTKNN